MLKTLAAKHRSTVTKMARKYKAKVDTPYGLRTCFEATVSRPGRKPLIARFGGIPLRRQKTAVIDDRQPAPVTIRRKELVTRITARRCEWCERRGVAMYGGGQFELGIGRAQIQELASLFHPDMPNDVAPGAFNEQGVPRGVQPSPLPPPRVFGAKS